MRDMNGLLYEVALVEEMSNRMLDFANLFLSGEPYGSNV